MSKLKCLCGEVLSNVISPNETEGLLLRNIDLEFYNKKSNDEIIEMGRDVWECNKCGRLAVSFPKKDDCNVKWYYPEDYEPGRLMGFDQK